MTMTVVSATSEAAWIAHPVRALPEQTTQYLLGAIALLTFIIAGAFALAGAWLVLPFAGLEVLTVGLALHHLRRHAGDEERICLTTSDVEITRRVAGIGRDHIVRYRFPRYWTQLRIERTSSSNGSSPTRLFLRSHGREAEIGTMLTEIQKQDLARQLKQRLGT